MSSTIPYAYLIMAHQTSPTHPNLTVEQNRRQGLPPNDAYLYLQLRGKLWKESKSLGVQFNPLLVLLTRCGAKIDTVWKAKGGLSKSRQSNCKVSFGDCRQIIRCFVCQCRDYPILLM